MKKLEFPFEKIVDDVISQIWDTLYNISLRQKERNSKYQSTGPKIFPTKKLSLLY